MPTPDAYGIDPVDEPHYKAVIRREKSLKQADAFEDSPGANVRAVLVVEPPSGFDVGSCVILRREPLFPWCYEVSINGYPGFGVLETLRGKIAKDIDGAIAEEFSFSRTANNEDIRIAFPEYWRDKVRVTGGNVATVGSSTVSKDGERVFEDETTVATGRLFLGFSEFPGVLAFAETDPLTQAGLDALGFDENGDPVPSPVDANGFTTNSDPRVSVRVREVPFLASPVVRPCVSLVDTSIPSPIAAGALAFAAPVSGLGLSLISIEPRVYQELSSVFDSPIEPEV